MTYSPSKSLHTPTGMIWDLDNTLYRLDEALKTAFDHAFAKAVISAGVPLDMMEAVRMARASYEAYGYSGQVFIDQYGLDRAQLHYEYHDMVSERVIEASLETIGLMEALPHRHALVTHGSRDWAKRVLNHLQLSSFYPEDRIFALEDYNFEQKHVSRRSFQVAMERLELPASEIIVVEDTLKNLELPAAMGMTTVLIHHGQKPETLPAYIDFNFNNTVEMLGTIHNMYKE